MNRLSNRTLALLLAFAIAFSLGGTLLALGRLGITGMVATNESGYVNVSVTSRTAINLTTKAVDFGSGYVGFACNNCTMGTYSGLANPNTGCCVGFTNPQTGIIIENTGNVDVQLNANFSNTTFVAGTASVLGVRMGLVNNESQSCATLGATWAIASGIKYATVPVYDTGSENLGLICDRLTPNQANDTIQIHINITIPDNSPSGPKFCNVTITATGL